MLPGVKVTKPEVSAERNPGETHALRTYSRHPNGSSCCSGSARSKRRASCLCASSLCAVAFLAANLLLSPSAFGQKKAAQEPKLDCLSCHNDATLTSETGGKTHSVHVDGAKFSNSIHGSLGCNDCHADVKEYPHSSPAKVNC